MLRLLITNQRGGAAKTTTSISLARYFTDIGYRVLLIDTDPQGSVATSLRLNVNDDRNLNGFLVRGFRLSECVVRVPAGERCLDVLGSNRDTSSAESTLFGQTGRELRLKMLLQPIEDQYDVILIDVAPSITLLQTNAMIYTQQMLIPVTCDVLALQGAVSCLEAAKVLDGYFQTNIRCLGLLPVDVDKRLQLTDQILDAVGALGERHNIPVLPPIRTDATVGRALRERVFLRDFAPDCKAQADYERAAEELLKLVGPQLPPPPFPRPQLERERELEPIPISTSLPTIMPAERLLHTVLLNKASEAGRVSASYTDLRKATGLSQRTIVKYLRRLQERGLLHIISQGESGGRAFTYRVLPWIEPEGDIGNVEQTEVAAVDRS